MRDAVTFWLAKGLAELVWALVILGALAVYVLGPVVWHTVTDHVRWWRGRR
jgi:hypothetical protein